MTDWSVVGGDPAPGDVGSIRSASTSLHDVANAVDEILGALSRDVSGCGPERWSGSAADAFRERSDELPPHLHKARVSFGLAASALANYALQLEENQAEAARLLSAAWDAEAAHRSASAVANAHRRAAQQLVGKQVLVESNLVQLGQWKRAAVIVGDTGAVQTYLGQEAVQRNEGRQVRDALDSERTALRQADARVGQAASTLAASRRRAGQLREQQWQAGRVLRQALADAHDAGLNRRTLGELQHWLGEHGPEIIHDIAEVLSVAATVCTIAGLVFPALLPIAAGLTVAAGVAGLADHLVKFADGGYPPGSKGKALFVLDLSSDALALLPPTKFLKEGSKLYKAVDRADDAVGLGLDVAKTAVEKPGQRGDVAWVVAEHVAGRAVTAGAPFLTHQKSPVHDKLQGVVDSYARAKKPDRAAPFVVSVFTHGDGAVPKGMHKLTTDDVRSGVDASVGLLHDTPRIVRNAWELGEDVVDHVAGAADPDTCR